MTCSFWPKSQGSIYSTTDWGSFSTSVPKYILLYILQWFQTQIPQGNGTGEDLFEGFWKHFWDSKFNPTSNASNMLSDAFHPIKHVYKLQLSGTKHCLYLKMSLNQKIFSFFMRLWNPTFSPFYQRFLHPESEIANSITTHLKKDTNQIRIRKGVAIKSLLREI